jgi:hypothetical protein
MKYGIDECGYLYYVLNDEQVPCICPKMTRGPKAVMFCGLDCPFFGLHGGFGGITFSANLSCSSIEKDVRISVVAKNVVSAHSHVGDE